MAYDDEDKKKRGSGSVEEGEVSPDAVEEALEAKDEDEDDPLMASAEGEDDKWE